MSKEAPTLPSALEVRGLGLISVPLLDEITVDLIVDLAKASGTRLGGTKSNCLALIYLVFTGVIFMDCQMLYLFGQSLVVFKVSEYIEMFFLVFDPMDTSLTLVISIMIKTRILFLTFQ